jgi:hypothetical protein
MCYTGGDMDKLLKLTDSGSLAIVDERNIRYHVMRAIQEGHMSISGVVHHIRVYHNEYKNVKIDLFAATIRDLIKDKYVSWE